MKNKSNSQFIEKILSHYDKIDSENIKSQIKQLHDEWHTLQYILNSISEGVVIVSIDAEILFLNDGAKKLLDNHHHEWGDKNAQGLFDYLKIDNPLSEFKKNKGLSISHQVKGISTDYSTTSVQIFPVFKDKKIKCFSIVLDDVSVQHQSDSESVEDSKLESIRLMSASIAHEIGNPLNNIDIHLQLAKKELARLKLKKDDSLNETIEIVHNEVKRIHHIIHDFLSAVRPLSVEYEGVDINNLIQDIMQSFKESLSAKGIHLKLVLQSNLSKIQIDANQIKQAIVNLIKNSEEAMGSGGMLVIKTENKDNSLQISIEDDGHGIPKELMGRLFEPYITTKSHGSGLGLMIVRRIIKDHHGNIEVKSNVDEGTSMRVTLPYKYRPPVKLISSQRKEQK